MKTAIAAAAALALLAAGLLLDAERALFALLAAAFVATAASLGALALLALFQVSNAGFHATLKRALEAMALALPVGAIALFAVLARAPIVWPWAAAPDTLRGAYLSVPAVAGRAAVFVALWLGFALALRHHSLAQDADGRLGHTRSGVALSAIFLVAGGYSLSLASVDWLMSTDPRWASTIFGFYTIGSVLLAGIAASVVVVILLRRAGRLPQVNESHLHDLGKLLFGLSTLWAYLWFSQYLLIWYANLPEETAWILARTRGGWGALFWVNLAIGWAVPFLVLLPRPAKRSERVLLPIALLVLVGRFVDAWVIVAPAKLPHPPALPWIEAAAFAALASLFALAVRRALAAAPMVPRNDPYLQEALEHRT